MSVELNTNKAILLNPLETGFEPQPMRLLVKQDNLSGKDGFEDAAMTLGKGVDCLMTAAVRIPASAVAGYRTAKDNGKSNGTAALGAAIGVGVGVGAAAREGVAGTAAVVGTPIYVYGASMDKVREMWPDNDFLQSGLRPFNGTYPVLGEVKVESDDAYLHSAAANALKAGNNLVMIPARAATPVVAAVGGAKAMLEKGGAATLLVPVTAGAAVAGSIPVVAVGAIGDAVKAAGYVIVAVWNTLEGAWHAVTDPEPAAAANAGAQAVVGGVRTDTDPAEAVEPKALAA